MRPRTITATHEIRQIIDQATREQALAVLSTHGNAVWHSFKSRFLEHDASGRFVVLDYLETHGVTPPELIPGQYVGISFRHRSRKIMFATVVEARGKYMTGAQTSVAAIRYRWPDALTELQRRAYQRTLIPADKLFPTRLWLGGADARATLDDAALLDGTSLDLSCGGTLVRLAQPGPPDWRNDQTVGVELNLPDGEGPVVLNAHYRGARVDEHGVSVAVQFIGLELSLNGRRTLQRLGRALQRFEAEGYVDSRWNRGER